MRERPITKFRPGLEPLEEKRPLSVTAATAPLVSQEAGSRASSHQLNSLVSHVPNHGYLVYRLTNPNQFNDKLIPPFSGHVLVQARQPVPGQVYNVLQVAVRNGTARTFDASSGFRVKLSGQHQSFPILTGSEQWKPGQEFVFYVLTKKYYPLPLNRTSSDNPSVVTGGFEFDLGNARSIAIPGPSGIFLRLKYNPATINRTLDQIVAFGPGAEGGSGIRTGIADTAIYEFLSARTRKRDFGGYF